MLLPVSENFLSVKKKEDKLLFTPHLPEHSEKIRVMK
jgi:hypothetical protein